MSSLYPWNLLRGIASKQSVHRELVSYLTRAGFAPAPGGSAGELWQRDGSSDLAVPYELRADSPEFAAIVRRLSAVQEHEADEVALQIEREFQDVQSFRVAGEFVIDDSVYLEAASTILTAARRMIRAAATTSRKPRPRIGSNYSVPADALANRARLSHTRQGSFVIPIVMPVDPPTPGEDEIFENDAVIEPAERRVTRTVATALAAIDSLIVRPDREPSPDILYELVQRGVSRELVAAVRSIAADTTVHAFDSTFSWAPGLGSAGRLPERIVIPSSSVPILTILEEHLASAPPDEGQTVSGPIAEIRDLEEDPTGEVVLRVVRNNRLVEVRIIVDKQVVMSAHDWAKQRRAVIARGAITYVGGRLLMVDAEYVVPIDEVLLQFDDEAQR